MKKTLISLCGLLALTALAQGPKTAPAPANKKVEAVKAHEATVAADAALTDGGVGTAPAPKELKKNVGAKSLTPAPAK